MQKTVRGGRRRYASTRSKRAIAKCMDQLVIIMLLFRTWAVLSACRVLPAERCLHREFCTLAAASMGSGLNPWDCRGAGQNTRVGCLRIATCSVHRRGGCVRVHGVHVQALLAGEHPLFVSSSIIPAAVMSYPACRCNAVCSPRRNSAAPKRRSCSMCEICIFFLLFLQIFLFGNVSFVKVKNNKDKM